MNSQLIFAFGLCLAACAALPVTTSTSNVTASPLNVTASGLQLSVYNSSLISYGTSRSQEHIVLMLDSLMELGMNGMAVSSTQGMHMINNLNTTIWNVTEPRSTNVSGIEATGVNLTTVLSNKAQLLMSALLLEKNGNISTSGMQLNATAGALWISLQIRNWTFCNATSMMAGCNTTGELLDIDIAFRGLNNTIKHFTNSTWSIGDNFFLWLDPDVRVDNSTEPMMTGYPTVVPVNNTITFPSYVYNNYTTNLIRARIPAFTSVATWYFLIYLPSMGA
jgi:hypothetical protein